MKCGRGHVNHTKKKKWSVGMPLFLRLQFKSITNFPAYLSLKCMRNLDFISKKKERIINVHTGYYSSNGWPVGRSWIGTDTASLIDEVSININIPPLILSAYVWSFQPYDTLRIPISEFHFSKLECVFKVIKNLHMLRRSFLNFIQHMTFLDVLFWNLKAKDEHGF